MTERSPAPILLFLLTTRVGLGRERGGDNEIGRVVETEEEDHVIPSSSPSLFCL